MYCGVSILNWGDLIESTDSGLSGRSTLSSDMSFDRVDLPDSPLSVDSIKSPQFNIETPQYIEYVGGVRIVDHEKLSKYRQLNILIEQGIIEESTAAYYS